MSFWLIILLALSGAAVVSLLYGFFLEPVWIRTRTFTLSLGDQHPLAGKKVLFFSDLHVGRSTTKRKLARQIRAIQAREADAIIFGGDLVEEGTPLWDEDFRRLVTGTLTELRAPLGKWALFGNHDVEAPRYRRWVTDLLESAGFTLLENERLPLPGLPTWAFANTHHGEPSLDEARLYEGLSPEEEPAFTLYLVHESDWFPQTLPARRPGLVLAGHSHYGQVTLFGLPLIRPPGAKRYWRGRYPLTEDLAMIVSAGLGTVHIHARFFARPDIILLEFV